MQVAVTHAPSPDSLRSALDSVFAGPTYRWVEAPAPVRALRRWWALLIEWLRGLNEVHPDIFRALVALLILVLVAVLVHAGYVMVQTLRAGRPLPDQRRPISGVERRDAGWYFREADRLAAGARWSEAMRLAFQGVALRLEASGAIRYHPSKTPGELAREARLAGPDRARLRELVSGLYRHVFAGAPCDAEEWRRWRADAGGEWHAPAH